MESVIKENIDPYFQGEEQLIIKHIISQLSLREIVKYYGTDISMWKYFINSDIAEEIILLADEYNNYPLILEIIRLNLLELTIYDNINWIMQKAAYFGDIPRIEELINKGASDFETSMTSAAKGGQLKTMEYLLEKSKKVNINYSFVWYFAMNSSIEQGRMDIVEFIIKNGKNYSFDIQSAAKGGHLKSIEFVLEKTKSFNIDTENLGFIGAAEGGHLDILKSFKGTNFYSAMITASIGGHLNIINYLIEKSPEYTHFDWNTCMAEAAEKGHLNIVEFMMQPPRNANNYNNTLLSAVKGGHFDIMNLMISKGANNFNDCIRYARMFGRKSLIPFLNSFL